MKAGEFLGAQPGEDGTWRFHIPRELHGAFGGAFGGVVAAAAIMAARSLAGGRQPSALDIRFLSGLPAGTATFTPTVLHAGRTLACVSVDVCTDDGRLAAYRFSRSAIGRCGLRHSRRLAEEPAAGIVRMRG